MKCTCGATRLLMKLHLSETVFIVMCATCIRRAQTEGRWGEFKKIKTNLINTTLEMLVDLYGEEIEGTWGLNAPRMEQITANSMV